MAELGYAAMVLAAAVAAVTALCSLVGARYKRSDVAASARNGVVLGMVLSTVAVVCLLALLIGRDYSVGYVYEHVDNSLSLGYTVAALWAGQEGSLLLWLWLLALIAGGMALDTKSEDQGRAHYVLATLSGVQAFLALVLVLTSDPFKPLGFAAADGQGLNPLLRNVWMAVHPPVVFAAYALFTVPFAVAIGGLVTGVRDAGWLSSLRRWSLAAWLFLSAGILMGAWWAYQELGWGGYWGWDPVENASLIPWLLGTALLHSLLVQESRGTLRGWTLALAALSFVSCLFATYITRGGMVQSVHSFAPSSLGRYFSVFMILCVLGYGLLIWRKQRDIPASEPLGNLLSREAGLLYANLLLVGAAALVLVGILIPALTTLMERSASSVDASYYERTLGPVMQALVLLIGICPWMAARGSNGAKLAYRLLPGMIAAVVALGAMLLGGLRESLFLLSVSVCAFVVVSISAVYVVDARNRMRRRGDKAVAALAGSLRTGRRRLGAHLAHLGIVLIALGLTGSSVYQSEAQVALDPHGSTTFGRYALTYDRISISETPDRVRYAARLLVIRDGKLLATLYPAMEYYGSSDQWTTEVAVRTTLREDLFTILTGFEQDGLATFRFLVNPLVVWIWLGGIVLMLGGALAWAPSRRVGVT